MTTEPLRPTALETVFYEPDERAVIAVVPGGLWLAPGDIVELADPAREGRVLSTRLQIERDIARVLIVVDVADDSVDAVLGATPIDVVLGAEIAPPVPTGDELDAELEQLTDDVVLAPAPDEG